MKLQRALTAGMAGLGLALAGQAGAQVVKPLGLSLRAGVLFPSDSGFRNKSNSVFAYGIDYKIQGLNLGGAPGMNDALSISLDHYEQGSYRATPIMLNMVTYQNQMYIIYGAGITSTSRPVAGGTSNKTSFGYDFGVGYNFQSGVTPSFLEARFFGSSTSELNGIGVYAGVRF